MDESAIEIKNSHQVHTPFGTPSPPNAASTVARPPPKPRRVPNIVFDNELFDNLSVHEDTPVPSPAAAAVRIQDEDQDGSHETSSETVVPANHFAIDPKYLAPTPAPKNAPQFEDLKVTGIFDATILEEVEPPSGIFLLEMTAKDDTKMAEFQTLAAEQHLQFQANEDIDMDAEEKSWKESSSNAGFDQLAQGQVLSDSFQMGSFKNSGLEQLVEEAEKSAEERNQFQMYDNVEQTKVSEEEIFEDDFEACKENVSISEYFHHKTSNLGGNPDASLRPNFGLEIADSPQVTKPVPMYKPQDIVEESIALTNSKNHELTKTEQNEMQEIARMILNSTPGHDKDYYVSRVLKEFLEKQKKELESSLNVSQMPSFLEATMVPKKSILHRHSSPKKSQNQSVILPSILENSEYSKLATLRELNFMETEPTKTALEPQTRKVGPLLDFNCIESEPLDQQETLVISQNSKVPPLRELNFDEIKSRSSTKKSEKIMEIESFKIPQARESCSAPLFPIEANKLELNFLTFSNKTEEQFVTLRNNWTEKSIKVSLHIREDSAFAFSQSQACDSEDSDHWRSGTSMDIIIGPQAKRDIFIAYKPHSERSNENHGFLVIKPHGISKADHKTLKSKVKLNGLAFEAFKMSIWINDQPVENVMTVEDSNLRIRVDNQSSISAYFKIATLDVQNPEKSTQFVVKKNEERKFKLNLNSKTSKLAIFYGPEMTRQAYKHELKISKDNSFLLGQNFKNYFENEQPLPTPIFRGGGKNEANKQFFNHIKRNLIQIQVVSENSFFPLNFTEDSTFQDKKKRTIHLEKDIIYFPTVTVPKGTSIAKITIKNRTDKPVRFKVEPLEKPFENYHPMVEVKPRHYLSIPIIFRPMENKLKCCTSLMLINDEHDLCLTAKLVGACQYV